jgi:hypothetical protein
MKQNNLLLISQNRIENAFYDKGVFLFGSGVDLIVILLCCKINKG